MHLKIAQFLSKFHRITTKGNNEYYFGFFSQYDFIGDQNTKKARRRFAIRKMFLIWEGFGITKYWRIV